MNKLSKSKALLKGLRSFVAGPKKVGPLTNRLKSKLAPTLRGKINRSTNRSELLDKLKPSKPMPVKPKNTGEVLKVDKSLLPDVPKRTGGESSDVKTWINNAIWGRKNKFTPPSQTPPVGRRFREKAMARAKRKTNQRALGDALKKRRNLSAKSGMAALSLPSLDMPKMAKLGFWNCLNK